MKLYQVFYTVTGAEGNYAAIECEEALGAQTKTTLTASLEGNMPPDIAHCQLSNIASNDFLVNCKQHAREIQCCGHGLLAAAHSQLEYGSYRRINLGQGVSAQRSPSVDGVLETWLTMPAIEPLSIDIPLWTSHVLSSEKGMDYLPVSAACTEPDDGYLLLQMPTRFRLEQAVVDPRALCLHTARALLLWQNCPEDQSLIKMRYFAPQYGNPEDAATGSVLRVLGPHLLSAMGLEAFNVSQCSSTGGRMSVRNMRNYVAITGNIRLIESE